MVKANLELMLSEDFFTFLVGAAGGAISSLSEESYSIETKAESAPIER